MGRLLGRGFAMIGSLPLAAFAHLAERKPLTDAQLAAADIGIAHHFGGGCYVKQTEIPAGASLAQHAHDHDHLSFLAKGRVMLSVDGVKRQVDGPACLVIEAGKVHGVQALTDVTWLCIWATDCVDPEKVDEHIMGIG